MIRKSYIAIVAGVILTALCCIPLAAQDVDKLKFPKLNEIKIPDVEKVTLDNGLRLYLLEDKSLPVFNVSVRVNGGSYLEPSDRVGLAEICGTVMRTGGTQKWTGDEIDEMLEGIGGSVETSLDVASGAGFINVLSEYTDLGLEVLAEVLRRPVFGEDKIELAKVQQRTAISRRNDDMDELTRREYRKLIYGSDSPYARHSEYKTVNAVTRDDLIAFHKTYFQPENIQMAVWGDFDKKDIIARLEKYFGDWSRGSVVVPPPPEVDYDWRSRVYYAEKADAAQSYIRVGHIGGLVTAPDYPDMLVVSSILGGGFGSRITDAVRTRLGLGYTAGGRYISDFAYPGYFFIVASTKPQSTVKATREIIEQIKSMHTVPPTTAEMQKGKDGYLNSFVFNFDSRREVVNRMMEYDFYGLPEDFLQQEKQRVENVTPDDIAAAAKKNLRPDEMVVLVIGNGAEFDEPLEALGLGPVDTIDIAIPSGEEEKELAVTPENLAMGRQLLAKAAGAAGGVANCRNIMALATKATITLSTPQGEFPVGVEDISVFPDKSRSVVSMMGQKLYSVQDGESGWKTSQTGEIVAMTEDDLKEQADENARRTILIFQKADDPSGQAVFDGSGESNGIACEYVVLLAGDGNRICRLGLEAQTGELLSKSYWGKTFMGEGNIDQFYSEFSDVSGIRLPMKTETRLNGQKISATEITEIVANETYPASTFAKPE